MVQVEGLDTLLKTHPFFAGMTDAMLALIAGCARNETFEAGAPVFREGGEAARFYILRHGAVGLEISVPGRGPVRLETLHEGDVLGWSWMVAPYRWAYDARAITLTRAISLDGACLRDKMAADHELAYHLHSRVIPVMAERLHAARLQMLDLYAPSGGGRP